MKRVLFFTTIVSLVLISCSPDLYKENINLGIKAARMKLWKEAQYRFKRAVDIKPTAKAYNNLAVAYEALGNFDMAEACYKKALTLDPHNEKIRANYAIFLELKKRNKKRKKKK